MRWECCVKMWENLGGLWGFYINSLRALIVKFGNGRHVSRSRHSKSYNSSLARPWKAYRRASKNSLGFTWVG